MTTTEDRERTRNQLQGLAELARPLSADSSGYVDLSAFSSSDPRWVESALARSRGSEPPKIDRLEAESMHPVALESLVDPAERGDGRRSLRMQKAFIIGSSVCIAGLSVAALVLAIRPAHAPRPVQTAAQTVVAASPPPQTAPADAPPAQAAAPVAAPDPAAPVAVQPQTPGSTVASADAPKAAKRKLAAPPSQARSRPRASSSDNSFLNAPSPGRSTKKSGGAGGDALMGAIQQSMAAPPKK